ncbi:hypothetical protein RUM44_002411 [Polyplax serrata]|uniref:Disease resistance R13L4/SHOC-2-like LRR domain-containing protein n=1 Tax=Polyplax serrata TaxID=468196 RepID=A0ABR1AEN9_POLSC
MLGKLSALLLFATVFAVEFPAKEECPKECYCHYIRVNYVTDCSERNLTEIPLSEISPNVYVLDVRGNEISEVRPFPEDVKLRRLQMADNKISELTSEMFSGLKYMVDIDLKGNNISRVDPNSFRDSHGLIAIELQGNPLMNVKDGPFLKCKSLLHLNISNCSISRLSTDFFAETPLLTQLDLSENPLGDVNPSVFRPLVTLSELMLNNCNLTDLAPDFLEHQTHLRVLELSGNKLTRVDWLPIFGHLPRLEYLNLKSAALENLPGDVFANNSFLRLLTLSGNPLTDFDIETTLGENLKNLHSLDLSNCNLTGPLDEMSFMNATSLRNLDLSGNSLSFEDLSVALSPLTKLTTLNLRDCSLSELPSNTFENLTQLKELDISRNPLNNIFHDLLDSLEHLEYLNMGYSNLSKLSKETFLRTTNLQRLILSGNDLGEVEVGLFRNLRNIEILEIENCNMKNSIDEKVFSNETYGSMRELKMGGNPLRIEVGSLFPEQMGQLKVLDLSRCNLSYLPDECFKNIGNLTHLNLSVNNFTDEFMQNTSFLDVLTNLEYLDLSQNQLTKLSTKVVEKTKLRDVKLIDNPWICDCTLADWWKWAERKDENSHLIGSALTSDDLTTKRSRRRHTLLCRTQSSLPSPLESERRTWAGYLKDNGCFQNKTRVVHKIHLQYSGTLHLTPSPPQKEVSLHRAAEQHSGRSFYIVAIAIAVTGLITCFAVGYSMYARQRRFSKRGSFDIQMR